MTDLQELHRQVFVALFDRFAGRGRKPRALIHKQRQSVRIFCSSQGPRWIWELFRRKRTSV